MQGKVEQVLETMVRPSLCAHGGDIQIQSCREGVLVVKLLGQCADCPSAMETTKNLVEVAVRQAVPEITEVILDDSVDQALLDMARRLLRHEAV